MYNSTFCSAYTDTSRKELKRAFHYCINLINTLTKISVCAFIDNFCHFTLIVKQRIFVFVKCMMKSQRFRLYIKKINNSLKSFEILNRNVVTVYLMKRLL